MAPTERLFRGMPRAGSMLKPRTCGYLFLVLMLSLAGSVSALAQQQQQDDRQQRDTQSGNEQRRTGFTADPTPDFARQNLNRVAASSAQIREVLVKDVGLMVELKRWVAKEATDNGQIVEDSSLTDDAIFDRLEHDLVFRSVATRLAQRYGYLLPNVNPDSQLGKEQELI